MCSGDSELINGEMAEYTCEGSFPTGTVEKDIVFEYTNAATGLQHQKVGELVVDVEGADLSDYPDMFVQDGRLDGFIVVGDKAPAADVIAATDIIAALQYYVEDIKVEYKGFDSLEFTSDSMIVSKGYGGLKDDGLIAYQGDADILAIFHPISLFQSHSPLTLLVARSYSTWYWNKL